MPWRSDVIVRDGKASKNVQKANQETTKCGMEGLTWRRSMPAFPMPASPMPARAVADVLIPVLPNVQVLEFEGLGHMGPITHPTVVNDATVAFLNRIA